MHQVLNTLYVTTQGSYLRLDRETVRVEVSGETARRIPFHHLGSIVVFGNVLLSPFLLHRCAEDGRAVVLMSETGRFRARVEGPVSGNVLLRRAQHEALDDDRRTLEIARRFVGGKLQNARIALLRGAREAADEPTRRSLAEKARQLEGLLRRLPSADNIDAVRGVEGRAARAYFDAFPYMIRRQREAFPFEGRNRRPPRDRLNALLSFIYALLLGDCCSALEAAGLDPQVGFLHALRPGRAALGLDLMEELRAPFADRLALSLINRRQLTPREFSTRPGGAVMLGERGRKKVIVAYQEKKQIAIRHSACKEKVPWGLVPIVQARLLARHIRGDLDLYMPFVAK